MDSHDPYIAYTKKFFARWARVYDLFGLGVRPAYGAAIRGAQPGPGRTILDVCTGTGAIALGCARRRADVTGVDISPSMLERARKKAARRRLDVRFEERDVRELPFADHAFDSVVISFALHDMPRNVRLQVLREAARVCRERLVVLDYWMPSTRWLRAVVFHGIATFESPYFRSFVRDDLRTLFHEAGLPVSQGKRVLPWCVGLWRFEVAPANR